ncbi:MAG: thioredoxin domain-containing protein [Opitutus sp.]
MPNSLAREKSPYLLQHADNPVDWMPWGEAAFAKARAEEKPIFLSIGYATCHWCHVMAHESFENAEVAKVLNESFVSIKVDREERPDVDKVYMTYVQAMTGHGGWPLSAWLTPELKPFYGGTYFPTEDRQGRAGFTSLLRAIANGWKNERDKLVTEGERVIAALRDQADEKHGSAPSAAAGAVAPTFAEEGATAFEKCFQHLYESFDSAHGGFGGAPKFPRASNLDFLFRASALQGVQSDAGTEAVKLANATLQAMARGGVHDHVGGGYHRYSVDEGWFVPHFEKMLYDQAQIAVNALQAKQASGDERFSWMAKDIFTYVLRDLTHPNGGFHSAEDADSVVEHGKTGHAEGAFYVWTRAQIAEALGEDAPMFSAHYGIVDNGNVPAELDPQHELTGKNILAQRQSIMATASQYQMEVVEVNDRILAGLETLRAIRERRPRPLLDDKIITAWNGLMISALARAYQVLGDGDVAVERGDSYLSAASRAAEFVERELYDGRTGVLYRSWRSGRGDAEGFAEDYACLIQGLLDLYEAGFELRWLVWAERLQATMDERFWDGEHGGYFNSQAGDSNIVLRLKEDYDGAEPAASSVAASNLLRLGAIFDGPAGAPSPGGLTYRERGRWCIAAYRGQWIANPYAMPQMLSVLELALDAPRHVVIAGDPKAEDFRALTAVLHERIGARRTLLAVTSDADRAWLGQRAPWLMEMKPKEGCATAFVCEEFACQAPVNEPAQLRRLLG